MIVHQTFTVKTVVPLDTNKKEFLKFNQISFFFHTILGFTKTEGSRGTYTREKPIKLCGFDNILLGWDFIDGSIENAIRQSVSHSFVSDRPHGQLTIKRLRIGFYTKNFCVYGYVSCRRW